MYTCCSPQKSCNTLQKVHGHFNPELGYLSCMFDISASGTEQM